METVPEQYIYPIGKYNTPEYYMPEMQGEWIDILEAAPTWLDPCIENLDEEQLSAPYRPGGWNITQIIHHMADSHMNAFIRLKLALTEDNPVVKPYFETLWAETPEIETVPLNVSITLLHALHRRWGALLRNMAPEDWERTYYHPEQDRNVPLWEMTDHYCWHSRHHMEQIRSFRNRMNW